MCAPPRRNRRSPPDRGRFPSRFHRLEGGDEPPSRILVLCFCSPLRRRRRRGVRQGLGSGFDRLMNAPLWYQVGDRLLSPATLVLVALALLTATKMPRLRGIALIADARHGNPGGRAPSARTCFPTTCLLAARIEGCGGLPCGRHRVVGPGAPARRRRSSSRPTPNPARTPDGHSRHRSRRRRACGCAGARAARPFGGRLRSHGRDRQRRVVPQQRGDPCGHVLSRRAPCAPATASQDGGCSTRSAKATAFRIGAAAS